MSNYKNNQTHGLLKRSRASREKEVAGFRLHDGYVWTKYEEATKYVANRTGTVIIPVTKFVREYTTTLTGRGRVLKYDNDHVLVNKAVMSRRWAAFLDRVPVKGTAESTSLNNGRATVVAFDGEKFIDVSILDAVLVYGSSVECLVDGEVMRVYFKLEEFALLQSFIIMQGQPQAGLKDIYNKWIGRAKDVATTATWLSTFKKTCKENMADIAALVTKIICMVINMSHDKASVLHVVERLVDFYLVVTKAQDLMHKESLESLMFSSMVTFLPKRLQDIVTRISSYTNQKLLDDVGLFHAFFGDVMAFVWNVVESYMPSSWVERLRRWTDFGYHHKLLVDVKKLVEKASNKSVYLDPEFRQACRDLNAACKKNEVLIDWARNSAAVKSRLDKISRMAKASDSYETTMRREPVCFVLEGPPGCGKSTMMAKVLQALKAPIYTLVVADSTDGKMFCDQYPDPEDFADWKEHFTVCDDMGQQGPSQFRWMMNMISCIKMPLPCAEADKKDTKFFMSSGVWVTTNRFTNLVLTKSDGIDELAALHRRAVVFDFSGVSPATELHGPKGVVTMRHYRPNAKSGMWIAGPPSDVRKWMKEKNFKLEGSCAIDDESVFLTWLAQWYTVCSRAKKANQVNNELSDSIMTAIAEGIDSVPEAGWFDWSGLVSVVSDKINDLLDWTDEHKQEIKMVEAAAWVTISVCLMVGTYRMYTQAQIVHGEREIAVMVAGMKTRASTGAELLRSQSGVISFANGQSAVALASGHYLMTVYHTGVEDKEYVTFYKDKELNVRYLDKVPAARIWFSKEDDVAIWKIDSALLVPFKKLGHHFKMVTHSNNTSTWMIHPSGCIALNGRMRNWTAPVRYEIFPGEEITHPGDKVVAYDFHGVGLCGSVIFNDANGVIGHHVMRANECGVAKLFSNATREHVGALLSGDKYILKEDVLDRDLKEFSGMKIGFDPKLSSPKENPVCPGPLYGVFPPSKEPANFMYDGAHTVKTCGKASLSPVENVNVEDLNFAVRCMDYKIGAFHKFSDFETICGTSLVAGLNMSTSSGYKTPDKALLVDKQKGELTPLGEQLRSEFYAELDRELISVEKVLTQETLKAEVRPLSKKGKPRTFRVVPFIINYELKRLTGSLLEKVITDRWSTGLCLGINPYRDFDLLYKELQHCNIIASDIGDYDKKMLPQVQFAVRDLICNRFVCADRQEHDRLRKLLTLCICTYVGMNDDVYLTTHSMPSGCYLTALGNSMVQQVYTLMWYHHMYPNDSPIAALNNMKDYVMGDDKLCGISPNKPLLTAKSFAAYMATLGLTVTNCYKKEIVDDYDPLMEVEFLKRKFYHHPKLGMVVGVLSYETLLSSISFVDKSKDLAEVLSGKLASFQHEAYLHYDAWETLVEKLDSKCKEKRIPFVRLPESYLKAMFESGLAPYAHEHMGGDCI